MSWNHYEENTRATPEELAMPTPTPTSAFDHQVGGAHYKQFPIQPYEFFFKNKIPHHKAAIIRRILRYDHPTGKGLTDLQKIKHEIDLIIELEFKSTSAKELPHATREPQASMERPVQGTTPDPAPALPIETPSGPGNDSTPSDGVGLPKEAKILKVPSSAQISALAEAVRDREIPA